MDDEKQQMRDIERAIKEIAPILEGRDPQIQGAILGELVSMFFAGIDPRIREESIAIFERYVRNLIAINEEIIKDQYDSDDPWAKEVIPRTKQ